MLMQVSRQTTEVHLAKMVMPRSRSRSLRSSARSATCWCSRNAPDWRRRWSTSVVLPWSTWAMIATLRICMGPGMRGCCAAQIGGLAGGCEGESALGEGPRISEPQTTQRTQSETRRPLAEPGVMLDRCALRVLRLLFQGGPVAGTANRNGAGGHSGYE